MCDKNLWCFAKKIMSTHAWRKLFKLSEMMNTENIIKIKGCRQNCGLTFEEKVEALACIWVVQLMLTKTHRLPVRLNLRYPEF